MKVQQLTNNNDLKCQLNLAKQFDTVKFGMSFEYELGMKLESHHLHARGVPPLKTNKCGRGSSPKIFLKRAKSD